MGTEQGASAPPGELVSLTAARLAGLDGTPIDEHVAVYDDLHRGLSDALAAASPDADPRGGAATSGPRSPGRPGPRP